MTFSSIPQMGLEIHNLVQDYETRNDFILNYQENIMKGLCHKCHASNVDLELDENNIPMCIKCRDPLDVDHTNP